MTNLKPESGNALSGRIQIKPGSIEQSRNPAVISRTLYQNPTRKAATQSHLITRFAAPIFLYAFSSPALMASSLLASIKPFVLAHPSPSRSRPLCAVPRRCSVRAAVAGKKLEPSKVSLFSFRSRLSFVLSSCCFSNFGVFV